MTVEIFSSFVISFRSDKLQILNTSYWEALVDKFCRNVMVFFLICPHKCISPVIPLFLYYYVFHNMKKWNEYSKYLCHFHCNSNSLHFTQILFLSCSEIEREREHQKFLYQNGIGLKDFLNNCFRMIFISISISIFSFHL